MLPRRPAAVRPVPPTLESRLRQPITPLRHLPLVLAGAVLIACGGSEAADRPPASVSTPTEFDGAAAMDYVRRQLAFGPRVPGSTAHRQMAEWLVEHLRTRADTVILQAWTHTTADGKRIPMRNVLARFSPGASTRVLYVAHWDSRPRSEKGTTAEARALPVPGANDGASGVAILLGVADALAARRAGVGVDLLFVDGEDWGDFDTDTDVLIGSRYFAQHLPDPGYMPAFGVVWDMVGKPDSRFQYESHSMRAAPDVVQRVWATAKRLGHEAYFPPREQGPVTDDHLPLIEAGLKVIDVIDLAYEWHHTPEDTLDKVSQRTLQVVGDVAITVLREFR